MKSLPMFFSLGFMIAITGWFIYGSDSSISDRREQWFREHLMDLIYREDVRDLFPYIYPFFIAEEDIFFYLKEHRGYTVPEWINKQLIYSLINNNFPNGLPSENSINYMQTIISNFPEVIKTKFAEALTLKSREIFATMNSKPNIIQEPQNYNNNNLQVDILEDRAKLFYQRWINYDVNTIAKQLSYINYQTLKQISIKDLVLWLQNQDQANTIKNIFKEDKKITNHFAYMIVSESNPDERLANFKKLCQVIKRLENLENYEGMFQVYKAITKEEVTRLFENFEYQEAFANEIDIINKTKDFFSIERNPSPIQPLIDIHTKKPYYKANIKLNITDDYATNNARKSNYNIQASYWDSISLTNKNSIYLPAITKTIYEIYKILIANEKEINIQNIIELGQLVKQIYYNNKQSYFIISYEQNHMGGFFGNILVEDEILQEYSNTHKPWLGKLKREMPQNKISEWTTMDLFSCLENQGNKEKTLRFLNLGIWNGASYLTYKKRDDELNKIK